MTVKSQGRFVTPVEIDGRKIPRRSGLICIFQESLLKINIRDVRGPFPVQHNRRSNPPGRINNNCRPPGCIPCCVFQSPGFVICITHLRISCTVQSKRSRISRPVDIDITLLNNSDLPLRGPEFGKFQCTVSAIIITDIRISIRIEGKRRFRQANHMRINRCGMPPGSILPDILQAPVPEINVS